jgi:hypothetical protein
VKNHEMDRIRSIVIASLLGILVFPILGSGPFPGRVAAVLAAEGNGTSNAELRDEIDELWDYIEELEERLVEEEKKSAWDRLSFYGDFRVRYAYEYWKLPAQSNFPTFTEFVHLNTWPDIVNTIDDRFPIRQSAPPSQEGPLHPGERPELAASFSTEDEGRSHTENPLCRPPEGAEQLRRRDR